MTNLIPRKILFGNPDHILVRLSPDGRRISYIAPHDGVLNIWVAPSDDLGKAKVLTNEKKRGIRSYHWAYSGEHIIYTQDTDGDENFHLHVIDLKAGHIKDVTPFEKVTAAILKASREFPEEMLVQINNRSPEFHDVYRLNICSGELTKVYENDQYAGFIADHQLRLRFAISMRPDSGQDIFKFDGHVVEQEPFMQIDPDDIITTSLLAFNKDNTKVYLSDSRGRNTGALTEIDLKTQKIRLIAEDKKADFCDLLINPVTYEIEAFASNYERKSWQIFDPEIADHIDALKKINPGDVEVVSRTLDDKSWVVAFLQDAGPVEYYTYDCQSKQAQLICVSNQKLVGQPLVSMEPVIIPTRDGLEMVSYLSRPADHTAQPLPMVLYVHGGPTARDEWGYSPAHQWLANRGYAVLSVNYRGSTGFGKKFITAGYGEWAGKAHDDLIDAVQWAVDHGIADPKKVAIMGGSYGGYATLVGLAMTPDVFACGVDIVGPSNLITLLESVPPYWKPMLDMLKVRIGGDHETEEGREFLKSQSPLNFAHQIKKPLLIGQGANDPRVKQAESDQIVSAMREKKIPVTYVLYPDEGHGFARPENRMSFFAVTEAFLGQCLGGRVETMNDDVAKSSMQIPQDDFKLAGEGK
jgi:dipeptidyl aminopeptidase/acylaminoacyl peptidase